MTSLDITRTPVAAIGGHAFDRQELIGAIAQVVNGRTAEIALLHTRAMARFEPAPDNAIAFTVGKESLAISLHEEFLLLTDSVVRRRELLDSHPEWFDCPLAEREAAVAAIATEENRLQRVDTAERWKHRSAAHF